MAKTLAVTIRWRIYKCEMGAAPVCLLMLSIVSDVPAPSDQALEITTTVTGLNPYTQYKFRAIGVNVLGEGQPSKPSCKSCTQSLLLYR